MSRRDIIIIGVLLNVGLLSVLFMMAIGKDESLMEQPVVNQLVISGPSSELIPIQPESTHIAQTNLTATDEWDNVIKDYAANISPQTIVMEEEAAEELEKESAVTPILMPETRIASASRDGFVEVKVKRGDALEKIARANGITVEALRKANDLHNDRLNIGQVLRVPAKGAKVTEVAKQDAVKKEPVKKDVTKKEVAKTETKTMSQLEKEYYTIKSGDNPWKIAKQFRVKFNDLLKLNDLDEEKARNLKIGDRIRVK